MLNNRIARIPIAIGLPLAFAIGGCGVLGPEEELAFYDLVEANGQTYDAADGPLLIGTIPYQDTECDLLLRLDGGGGYAYINGGTNTYHISLTMNIDCVDLESDPRAEANADERGKYSLRSGAIIFDPSRRTGLELTEGTMSGETIAVTGVIDSSSFTFFQFPGFIVDREFPIQLTFVKTAED